MCACVAIDVPATEQELSNVCTKVADKTASTTAKVDEKLLGMNIYILMKSIC